MSKIYQALISSADKIIPERLRPLWEHEAGPKTIFFWAPLCKWGLVLAGLGDLTRPADVISIPQSAALTFTGLIWSRYAMVIIPKNWMLFYANVLLCTVGSISLARAISYRMRHTH